MNLQTNRPTTVTAADIATMAAVGRSTVSNWRKRHRDFPRPVESEAGVRFSTIEVEAWLAGRGKNATALSMADAVFSLLDDQSGGAPVEDAIYLVGDLIAWRYLSEPASLGFDPQISEDVQWPRLCKGIDDGYRLAGEMDECAVRHVDRGPLFVAPGAFRRLFEEHRLLYCLVDLIGALDSGDLAAEYDAVRARATRTLSRGSDSATSDSLIDLFLALSGDTPGAVHDPVAGSGRLLAALAATGSGRPEATGQDIIQNLVVQANQRLLISGCLHSRVVQGDALEHDRFGPARAQVVVADPPYGLRARGGQLLDLDPRLAYGTPPRNSMDLAWPQIALWHLAPGGRAFVLQPIGSATRGGAEQKIRVALLQAGAIDAVIALPAGHASHTRIPLNLWVLSAPGVETSRTEVLMVDATSGAANLDFTPLARTVNAWRAGESRPDNATARVVDTAEILAHEAVLDPGRWLGSRSEDLDAGAVQAMLQVVNDSTAAVTRPTRAIPEAVTTTDRSVRSVSLAELQKAGHLEIMRDTHSARDAKIGDDGDPVITGTWVRGGDAGRIRRNCAMGRYLVTEPGDVLLQSSGTLAARVDPDGGRMLWDPSISLLRLTTDSLRPAYVAAAIVSGHNRSRARGSHVLHVNPRDLTIPVISLEEQDAVIAVLDEASALSVKARALEAATTKAASGLIDALAAGAIELR